MHQYLDTDGSGTNATCLSPAIGAQRLSAATEWLQENGYKGFLGEIGAGNNGQLSSSRGVIRITATDTLLPSLQMSAPRLSTSRFAAWPSRVPGWASAGGLLVPGGGKCRFWTTI
jgi:endoglucanase